MCSVFWTSLGSLNFGTEFCTLGFFWGWVFLVGFFLWLVGIVWGFFSTECMFFNCFLKYTVVKKQQPTNFLKFI